jgi:hypothetical protein
MKIHGKHLLPVAVALLTSGPVLAAPPAVELRAAVPCSAGTLRATPPGEREAVCFSPFVIATSGDFADIRYVRANNGEAQILFTLRPKSARALAEITAARPPAYNGAALEDPNANRIGLFVDGRIETAPLVMEGLRAGEFKIMGLPESIADLGAKLGLRQ